MLSQAALVFCLAFIVLALRQDVKESAGTSRALWIPFIWIALSASKPLPYWLYPHLRAALSNWTLPVNYDFLAGNALDRNFLIGMMLMGIIILYRRRDRFRMDYRKNAWLILLLVYMLMSMAWSQYPGLTGKRWIRCIGDLVMVLVILTEDDRREAFERIIRRCAIVLLPLSLVFIRYFRIIGVNYDPWGFLQYVGVTNQKNHLGVLCAFAGVYLLWRMLKRFPRLSYLDAFLFVLAMYLLIISRSATSVVVFITGSLFLAIIALLKLDRKSPTKAVIVLLIMLVVVQVLLTGYVGDSLLSRFFSATSRDVTLTGRVPLWRDLIAIGSRTPILGFGYGGFWFSNLSAALWTRHQWRPVSGHNGYLDIFLDLGLVGLILFLFLLVQTYKKTAKAAGESGRFGQLCYVFFVMIVLHNITESTFIKPVSFLWILFLYMAVEIKRVEADRPETG